MRIGLACLLLVTFTCESWSQKHDFVWILGGNPRNVVINGQAWGQSVLDFNYDPVRVYYDTTATLDTGGTNATVCDRDGNLILYTNGMQMHNGDHEFISGAETIAYSNFYDRFVLEDYLPDGGDWVTGFRFDQGIVCYPSPKGDQVVECYYQIREELDNGSAASLRIATSRIDYTESAAGRASYVDSIILRGNFASQGYTIAPHANGRDSWLLSFTNNVDSLILQLIEPDGGTLVDVVALHQSCDDILGWITISPNGQHLLIIKDFFCENLAPFFSFELLAFDRCLGSIESIFVDTMEQIQISNGGAFSPDGTILYVNNQDTLVQYDLLAEDIKSSKHVVALRDTTYDSDLRMGRMINAPDGRIYGIPQANSRVLHTIDYPDRWGSAAQWVQESTPIPTNNFRSVPNHPHYRMGPIDGSPCDTLGIDNIPIARFRTDRHVEDSLLHTFVDLSWYYPATWSWDMGDGTTYDMQHPYDHRYAAPGSYEVCLTISNDNGSDTTCKTLYVGVAPPTSTDDVGRWPIQIYPNPADDHLFVALDHAPQEAVRCVLVDMLGRSTNLGEIQHRNAASYDVATLPRGMYALVLYQGRQVVGSTRVLLQ